MGIPNFTAGMRKLLAALVTYSSITRFGSTNTGARTRCHSLSLSTTRGGNNVEDDGSGAIDLPTLVLIGDKELLTPCEPCGALDELKKSSDNQTTASDVGSNLKAQLDMLKACQKAYGGIGIAACQVGWRTRIFCMGFMDDDTTAKARYPEAKPFEHQFWINPTITPRLEHGTSWFWEGCLSVPGMRGWVERPNVVQLTGWNDHGDYVEMELDGLPARVAQHEYDHLDGILFPDRALQGTLLPVNAFNDNRQDRWPEDWPTRGARRTGPGGFSEEQ